MNPLVLVALYSALCYANANSNEDKIETLMDNGWGLFLHALKTPISLHVSLRPIRENVDSFKCMYSMSMITVVVLRIPHVVGTRVYVPVTCGEEYEHQSVFWKKDGNITLTTGVISPYANTSNNIMI